MRASAFKYVLCGLLGMFSCYVQAHGRWIVPSHTVLSGEGPEYVTFDISISNDIFNPDHAIGGYPEEKITNVKAKDRKVPPPIESVMDSTRLHVSKPDGSTQSDYTIVDFHRKSSAAALLDKNGTYLISLVQNPMYLTWFTHTDNSPGRLFGKASALKDRLPKGVKDIRTTKLVNTVETIITRNNVNDTAIKPKGKGLELEYLSHPNELFVGETLGFKILNDGKHVKDNLSVHLVRNDTRYRNNREDVALQVNDAGEISVEWEKPGLYLLEIEYEHDSTEPGIVSETHANYVVLEVFPE